MYAASQHDTKQQSARLQPGGSSVPAADAHFGCGAVHRPGQRQLATQLGWLFQSELELAAGAAAGWRVWEVKLQAAAGDSASQLVTNNKLQLKAIGMLGQPTQHQPTAQLQPVLTAAGRIGASCTAVDGVMEQALQACQPSRRGRREGQGTQALERDDLTHLFTGRLTNEGQDGVP